MQNSAKLCDVLGSANEPSEKNARLTQPQNTGTQLHNLISNQGGKQNKQAEPWPGV